MKIFRQAPELITIQNSKDKPCIRCNIPHFIDNLRCNSVLELVLFNQYQRKRMGNFIISQI
uniref:Uncharacterized protein n=1 Tax=Manihot esculenta TaxID=3983 RepID=A0A2C9UAW7_MANES